MSEVLPDPQLATVVFVRHGPRLAGKEQAATVVRDDAVYVGQLAYRSFFIAKVAAGRHLFTVGIPEASYKPDSCGSFSEELKPGRIYVVTVANGVGQQVVAIDPVAPDTLRRISYFSHLEVHAQKGSTDVAAYGKWWKKCIAHGKEWFEKLAPDLSGRPDPSLDALSVPQPP